MSDSLVAYGTKFHGIKIFDFGECGIKKSIANMYLDADVTASAFSPNSELFAFVKNRVIYILEMQSKEIIHTIEVNDEDIEIISFDLSSNYIMAGSRRARVLQYKINQPSLLSRLCSFPYDRKSITKEGENYVSSFAFYNNSFACSGYGGAIYIIDLYTQTNKKVITYNKTRINAMCFLDEQTLICAKDNGKIDIVSLLDEKSQRSIDTPITSIDRIIIMPNPNYIMVSGNSKIITIIDIKNYKIVHSKYIEFDRRIKYMDIVNSDSLIVALENSEILHVELPGITKLKSLMAQNSLKEAFELITKEPMLQGSHEHKMLKEKFEKSYDDALKALVCQNRTKATQILNPYKDIKSKENKIRELLFAFENYARFQELFLEKRYALAYAMSSKHEPLKRTLLYKNMEQIFRLAFLNAQKHIQKNNLAGARALLGEYGTVISKKPLIKLLLTQNKEFVEFLRAIQKRDFKSISSLVEKNELFGQIPNYIALNKQTQETILEIEADIRAAKIEKAKEILFTLREVPHLTKKVEELHLKCKHVILLQTAYKNGNFISCYELLDIYEDLRSTELGVLLEKHWLKLIQKCEEYAVEGNIKDIRKTLGQLLTLSSRSNKTGDLLRVSFHVRITILMRKNNFKSAEAIIYTYIDIFGIDSEISHLMKKFEKTASQKLAITQTQEDRPTRDSWRHNDIIVKDL
ncbi:WD40 repeat domain-containing protein [Sulfurimonas sp.]|uniref:WD40 repeat domain-containing protein n=1 Tax=Sulfurimonas sp. TaxID=2022749 RepID=UPI0025E7DB0B|nr:WD40 repeat domain-containing protein [Sulfurimonas sp.]